MKQFSTKARSLSIIATFSAALTGLACGEATSTINILPGLGGSVVQGTALGPAGHVTGFAFTAGDMEQRPFLSDGQSSVDLGTFGGFLGQGLAVNSSGQVAGESDAGFFEFHAFLYSGGTLTDLGTLGGSQSRAVAINDASQVAGSSYESGDMTTAAFLYSNGNMLNLGTLGGFWSYAVALNQAGEVAGNSETAGFEMHAFLYSNGTMLDIGSLGGGFSFASDLNYAGVVVGESSNADFETHAFAYYAGTLYDLGTLGGTYSAAYAINNAGLIVGSSTTTNDSFHGFLYANGAMIDLGTLGGSTVVPRSINNAGQIVGSADDTQGFSRAFIWQNGVLQDLNSLLPQNSGWELATAEFINDQGRIVGYGMFNGDFKWYVLDFGGGGENQPPVANAGPDQIADCGGVVTLSAGLSSDPDNDAPLSYEWRKGGMLLGTNLTLTGSFDAGTNVITLRVTDPCGAYSEDTVLVVAGGSSSPTIHSVAADKTTLWPPNNQKIPVTFSVVATDSCGGPVVSEIISITANEPLPAGDVQITGPLTALLAASKNAQGSERVYTITVHSVSLSGQSATATVQVIVPKSNGKTK